jgi:hypothetical protein
MNNFYYSPCYQPSVEWYHKALEEMAYQHDLLNVYELQVKNLENRIKLSEVELKLAEAQLNEKNRELMAANIKLLQFNILLYEN